MSVDTDLGVEEALEEAFAEEVPCDDFDVAIERKWLVLGREVAVDCDDPAVAYVHFRCQCGPDCHADGPLMFAMCERHLAGIRHDEEHGWVLILAVTPIGPNA